MAQTRRRYLVCGFGSISYAIAFDGVDYVLRSPAAVIPWRGSSVLSGCVAHQGRVVWLTRFDEFFLVPSPVETKRSWIVVLKRPELGLTQIGFFADLVRGPVSEPRLGNVQRVDQATESVFCDS